MEKEELTPDVQDGAVTSTWLVLVSGAWQDTSPLRGLIWRTGDGCAGL